MLRHRLYVYLDEVTRSGTIRAAARKLNVASSAINRQILALEQDLGTPVFERLPRRLRLTAAGELVIEHVREVLRAQAEVEARIADLQGLRWGRVTIATIGTVAAEVLPEVIAAFRRTHARSTIEVRVVGDVTAQVAAAEADFGVGFDLAVPPGIRQVFALPLRVGAVTPPGHPLAALREVPVTACAAFPLILPSEGMSTRPILDRAFQSLERWVNPSVVCNSAELMKQAVSAGQGVAFLTELNVCEEVARGELVFVPLVEGGRAPLRLTAIVKEGHRMNLMAMPFLRALEDAAGRLIRAAPADLARRGEPPPAALEPALPQPSGTGRAGGPA